MFYPLTPVKIKKYNKLYLDEIKDIKNNTCDEEELKNQSKCFWETFEDEIDYSTLLYLTRQFVIGNLYATTNHWGPIEEDHADSCPTLEKLALEGIFTSNGQRGIIEDEMRSYLSFEFPIEDYNIDNAIQLLKKLYKKGLNVSAIILKHNPPINHVYTEDEEYDNYWKSINNIILFKSDEIELELFNLLSLKYPIKSIKMVEVTVGYTYCPFDCPNEECYNFKNIKFPTDHRVKVSIFSQKWDDLQADQVLLDTIYEMKEYIL